jgi:hypothetical protein
MRNASALVKKSFLYSSFIVAIALVLVLTYGSPDGGTAMPVADTLYVEISLEHEPAVWPEGAFALKDHDLHPMRIYPPFFLGQNNPGPPLSPYYQEFFNILSIYEKRQGIDDNFSLRVINNATNELLEVHVLEAERAFYRASAREPERKAARHRKGT